MSGDATGGGAGAASGAPAHLTPSAAALLSGNTEDRIFEVRRDHWVGYPRAKDALDRFDDLLRHPRTSRMPNMLLCGPSGIGKTTIIDRFVDLHPVHTDAGGKGVAPVLALNMPTAPNEARFWSEMLRALCVSHRDSDSLLRKKNQAVEVLALYRCRLLMVDEFHNVMTGSGREQRTFLVLLKNLSNELGMPMVCAGTIDAKQALSTDTQLENRFETFGLRRWPLDADFQRFLMAYERQLPLAEPSGLGRPQLAMAIHRAASGGLIGEATRLVKDAAVKAIRSGQERITQASFEAVAQARASNRRQAEAW